MNPFWEKYANLLRWLLLTIIVTLSLTSIQLMIQTSSFWSAIIKDVWSCLLPFLIAFILAYVIHPLISKIESLHCPRAMSVFLFYFIIFGSLYILISWFLPTLLNQLTLLLTNVPLYSEQIQEQLTILDDRFDLNIVELVTVNTNDIFSQLGFSFEEITIHLFTMIGSIVNSVINLIIIPIALFYFLKDYERVLHGVKNVFPKRLQRHVVSIGLLLDTSLGAYIRGLFVIMFLLSIIATGLLMITDVSYPLLFGVLIGVTDFIPFIGPFIGAIPVLLYALSISWSEVIEVLIIIIILQFIEGNILQPYVMGRNIDMHPIQVMIVMLIAGSFFGFYGLLLAIPVFLMVKTIHTYYLNVKKQQEEEKTTQKHFPFK